MLISSPCIAQSPISSPDDLPRWDSRDMRVVFSGNGVNKKVRGTPYDGEAIFTTAIDKPGNVSFYCLKNVFGANIAVEPVDFAIIIDEWATTRRQRATKPTLTINGEKQKSEMWTYVPPLKLLIPRKKYVARKLYNASIRGSDVQLKMSGKKAITLILPKPNLAFADFGADCNMGKNKGK